MMRKYALLSGAAVAAVALFSGSATAQVSGGGEITYNNEVTARSNTDVSFTKDVVLYGDVELDGTIDVNAAAVATVDNKQILAGNVVMFSEENELDGENGFVDPVFGPGISESGQDPNDNQIDGVAQDRIRVGFFAPVINTVNDFAVDGEGNIGVNIASGYYNIQENLAAIAVSGFDLDDDETGGMAEASLTSLQSSQGNFYGPDPDFRNPEDDPEEGGSQNDFRVRNTLLGGDIGGDGNIGVNVAVGAFNMQKNAMVLAVATDSAMAEANAAVIQASTGNLTDIQDEQNFIDVGTIGGSGNVGVNLAAGVGNMQHNSLIIATSAGNGNGNGNGGNGGNGGNDPS